MSPNLPSFDFTLPPGYLWIFHQGWVGFNPFSGLQPWHYLDETASFSLKRKWPNGPSSLELVAFAKRQDCDDLACFEVKDDTVDAILVVNGWVSESYELVARYSSFWEWLKSVINDIAEWNTLG